MYGMYANGWPMILDHRTEDRDRYHRIAIHEARIATEWAGDTAQRTRPGLVGRIREVLGISAPQADCVGCAA